MEIIEKEIIIIGAGPAGLVCALEAAKQKLDYLILEKGLLANSIYNFPTNMTFFSTSELLEIGGVPFISHTEKPTRKEALEYYRRIASSHKLNIHYRQEVKAIRKKLFKYEIKTQDKTYMCEYLILATGFYDTPKLLNCPGEELAKVKHYYDDAHPYIGQDVVVIGAANSACDVALETWQKGAKVTMVIKGDSIYEKVKYWIKPNIENRIREGSIKAYFQSEVKEIKPDEVLITTPDGDISIPNDYVLAMTGYRPDSSFLENVGIDLSIEDKEPIINKETLETNMSRIYVAGVIVAGNNTSKLFIENTRHHGKKIIADIMQKRAASYA